MVTDTHTSSTAVNEGFGFSIRFGVILHIIDYYDKDNTY